MQPADLLGMTGLTRISASFTRVTLVHLRTAPDFIQQHRQLVPEVLRSALERGSFRRIEGGRFVVGFFIGLGLDAQIGAFELEIGLAQLAQQVEEPPLRLLRRHVGKQGRSEEHTSELQSRQYLVCRLLLEKKKNKNKPQSIRKKDSNQQERS